MTDKEYVSQLYKIDLRIDCIKRNIEMQVSRKEDTLSATDYSRDRVTGGAGVGDISDVIVGIEQYVEMQEAEIARLNQVKYEVVDVINSVRPNELSMLLMERYAHGRSWKEIAMILNRNEVSVRGELHDKALNEIGYIRALN